MRLSRVGDRAAPGPAACRYLCAQQQLQHWKKEKKTWAGVGAMAHTQLKQAVWDNTFVRFLSVSLIYSEFLTLLWTDSWKPICAHLLPPSARVRGSCQSQTGKQWKSPARIFVLVVWAWCSPSKKQHRLWCGTSVTVVGEKWQGSAKDRHRPAPTQPTQGNPGVLASASAKGVAGFVRAARERHLGLLTKRGDLGRAGCPSGRVRGRWWLPVEPWMVSRGEEGLLWEKWGCAVKLVFLLDSRSLKFSRIMSISCQALYFLFGSFMFCFLLPGLRHLFFNSAGVQWNGNFDGCQQSYFCGKLTPPEVGLNYSEQGVEIDWKHKSELKTEIASSTGDNDRRSAE